MSEMKDRMLKDFGLQKSDVMESPRQKAHREMMEDPDKMGHFICFQMNEMNKKGILPTWSEFTKRLIWQTMAMNMSDEHQSKFEHAWNKIYKQLMSVEDDSNKQDIKSDCLAQPVDASKQENEDSDDQ